MKVFIKILKNYKKQQFNFSLGVDLIHEFFKFNKDFILKIIRQNS